MAEVFGEIAQRVEEVAVLLTPDEGVDIYDVLIGAELRGFRSIAVHDDNTATVVLYQKET